MEMNILQTEIHPSFIDMIDRQKSALISGCNGQDGSYLAELLLSKGYKVYGTVRSKNPKWTYGFDPSKIEVIQADLGYLASIKNIFRQAGVVDELYNLAAQSHVGESFKNPEETYRVTGVGACLLMDEYFDCFPKGKFYQASTSEMFGNQTINQLNISSRFYPTSPYAVSKVMAHKNVVRYQDAGYYAFSGILFNHESERRHESFVTQKIAKFVALANKWKTTLFPDFEKPILKLGRLDTFRDWGYAPEYVKCMWEIVQREPSITVIATGETHSVEEFCEVAFSYVGLDWKDFVQPGCFDEIRPHEVIKLCGTPYQAKILLKRDLTTFHDLVKIMVDHQIKITGA